jgi:magnesium chelatase family protein
VPPSELSRAPPGEASAIVAARVAMARGLQRARGKSGGTTNAEAEIGDMALTVEARELAERAADKLRLSARGYTRTLRVARSIADLAGAERIGRGEIAEALAFRHRMPGRSG